MRGWDRNKIVQLLFANKLPINREEIAEKMPIVNRVHYT